MAKTGLVLEGGSFRGIFTAGVLDCLIENSISFPYVIGVSAGSGNAVNYIAGQKGRTQKVIMHENAEPYFGVEQMLKSKKLLDLDKMLFDYAYDQIPFDFNAFFASETESEFVVANCESGRAEYLTSGNDPDRLLNLCKASCSVPVISQPVEIDGSFYLDGSIIDSVPVKRAMKKGCEKAVVVLTRMDTEMPTDYSKMKLIINLCYKNRFPKVAEAMINRKSAYDKQMKTLAALEKDGRVFIIRPEMPSISHFEGDADKMNEFYRHGHAIMEKKLAELEEFLNT